jgi:hypothetical protein
MGDTGLARGAIAQRLEAELAPGSRAAALKLRAERRVNSDRSFQNFAQTTEQRRTCWRARPAATASAEAEARVTWQRATQAQVSGATFERTLTEQAGTAQWIWQPDVQWKVAAGSRRRGARAGSARPDAHDPHRPRPGAGVERWRAELTVRRGSEGAVCRRWAHAEPRIRGRGADGTARFDYRVHSSTTIGFTPACASGRGGTRR